MASKSTSPSTFPASKAVAGTTALPGFGLPLNYLPEAWLPNALSGRSIANGDIHLPGTTLREFSMLQLMDAICSKPDWHTKVNNPEIAKKWKEETLANHTDFSEAMADWCIAEVEYRASLITDLAHPPPLFVFNGDVYRSDTAVSSELKKALQDAVADFEGKILEKEKDWHPDSDGKVWDLVHPSLFPLVYGRTRILTDGKTTTLDDCIARCGEGAVAPIPDDVEAQEYRRLGYVNRNVPHVYSRKFQWLPCEVDISGERARIRSYINNLHPHRDHHLYGLIEQLIDAAIPLWELTLAPLVDNFVPPQRIECSSARWDMSQNTLSPGQGPQRNEGEDENDFWRRQHDWVRANRSLWYPEPRQFRPLARPETLDFRKEYGQTGLQVIVKLANIQLTPEKPSYAGGSWHIEGQLNEHIVSTALYYYSNENITQSSLRFRQQIDAQAFMDFGHEQNDDDWLPLLYGCRNWESAVQEIGGVKTDEGRLLTFPNILQHRVDPFELVDPTKPGHRKIVALFLVDPSAEMKVVSTAHVPCQQKSWWWDIVSTSGPDDAGGSTSQRRPTGLDKLPAELKDEVFDYVAEFPISLEEAKELRLELMKERSAMSDANDKAFVDAYTFSLCEH